MTDAATKLFALCTKMQIHNELNLKNKILKMTPNIKILADVVIQPTKDECVPNDHHPGKCINRNNIDETNTALAFP